VRNPVGLYLDYIDGTAFDLAESGMSISAWDPPRAPFAVPVLLGYPLIRLAPTTGVAWAILAVTTAVAIVCWVTVFRFYLKRVYAYRRQLGTDGSDELGT
jgi:hypothetical protein